MELNFPKYDIKIKREGEKTLIFDPLRKKYLHIGPEEIVRQHLIRYLIDSFSYPASKIKVEQSIKVLELKKRIDLVVYDNDIKPRLLVECKSPDVKITQKVLDQIGRYNMALKVPFLLVTNGLEHITFKIDFKENTFMPLKAIPHYNEII